jgi:transposase
MRRYELTDTQWDLIEDLFPEQTMGRPRLDDRRLFNRRLFNGILWILCSGAAWRDLPERYGKWQTVYSRFRRWEAMGLFDRILDRLQIELDEHGLIDYAVQRFLRMMVDSTSIRASRAAAGAPNAGAPNAGAPKKKGAHVRPLDAREAV